MYVAGLIPGGYMEFMPCCERILCLRVGWPKKLVDLPSHSLTRAHRKSFCV